MRTATVFNFLLEANLMASAAILLMIAFRRFLRKPLGNKLIYFMWLLIAIRLVCPLALSNPLINEIRPGYLSDEAIRPIAGQIKIRLTDAVDELRRLSRGNTDSIVYPRREKLCGRHVLRHAVRTVDANIPMGRGRHCCAFWCCQHPVPP